VRHRSEATNAQAIYQKAQTGRGSIEPPDDITDIV